MGNVLFTFGGRINRAKYWLAVLVYFILGLVTQGLGYVAGARAGVAALLIGVLLFVVGIATTVSAIAVGIKRLHDRDKSGWWLLPFGLLPGVLAGAGAFAMPISTTTGGVLLLGALAVCVWAFVELGCLRGTAGANRFGPDPLAGGA